MRFDRHLFGSRHGYETLSHSKGVTPDEQAQLSELGFGQTSDPTVLASLESRPCVLGRPLRSRRIAITRVFEGSPDDAGRPTLQLRTLVMDANGFHAARSQIDALLHDGNAWQRDAFENGEPFEWKNRLRPPATPTDEAWHLADWAMELQGREDIVLRVPDDPRGEAAILSLVSSVSNTDACSLRWGLRLFSTSAAADICSLLPSAALSPRRRVVDVALSGPFKHAHLEDPRLRAKGIGPFERLRSPEQVGPGYALESQTRATPGRSIPASHAIEPDQPRSRRWVVAASIAGFLIVGIGLTLAFTWPRRDSTTTAVAQAGPSSNQDTRGELGDSAGVIASDTGGEADTDAVEEVLTTDDASTFAAAPSEPKTPTTGRKPPQSPLVDPNGGLNITGPGALGAPSTSSPAEGDDPKDPTNPREETSRARNDPEDPFADSRERLNEEKSTFEDDEASRDAESMTMDLAELARQWDGVVDSDRFRVLDDAIDELKKQLNLVSQSLNNVRAKSNFTVPENPDSTNLSGIKTDIEALKTALDDACHLIETTAEDKPSLLEDIAAAEVALASMGIDLSTSVVDAQWMKPPRLDGTEGPFVPWLLAAQGFPEECNSPRRYAEKLREYPVEVANYDLNAYRNQLRYLKQVAGAIEDIAEKTTRLTKHQFSAVVSKKINELDSYLMIASRNLKNAEGVTLPDVTACWGSFNDAKKYRRRLERLLGQQDGQASVLVMFLGRANQLSSGSVVKELMPEGGFLHRQLRGNMPRPIMRQVMDLLELVDAMLDDRDEPSPETSPEPIEPDSSSAIGMDAE